MQEPEDVSPHSSLCLWTGLVIHWVPGVLLRALWNGSMRITSEGLCVESLQPSKNSRLSEPHSSIQLTPLQQTEGFGQTSWLTP
ncbi:Hypothetical predicted protein [Lynx pardinus]|uniref:Uncharacterized protein n=1 Tax=Lynx pardinus TaxID=191816 RepID=A0A485P1Z0_LYNPA|nr:Hypothetical predicted protein [Lynx pardinus]